MTSELVDIGANLTDRSFAQDLDQVVLNAREAGVRHFLVTGTNLPESRQAADLCTHYPDSMYSTAGIHPHHAKEWDNQHYPSLKQLASLPQVLAIGETGLDYNRDFSPQDQQRAAFEQQLQLASETGLPLFLHERDAHDDQIAMLRAAHSTLHGGVIHCFTGQEQALENYLELDLYVGITGWICDERRGLHLRELVKRIPAERLLLETDCPYLLPRTLKPKPKSRRNEPCYLPHIAEQVAGLLGVSPEQLAHQTTVNAKRLFKFSFN